MGLSPGDRIEVLSDDPLAGIDLPLFCRQEGHRLLEESAEAGDGHRFLIERG